MADIFFIPGAKPANTITNKPHMKILIALLVLALSASAANLRVEAVPENGVQPQVAADATGAIHLVYLKGDPKACDVRYVRRAKGARDWSAPVSVNSEPQSAIAMGTIRGAQIALGKGGTLHIVWNGAMKPGAGGSPLFYSRAAGAPGKFAPQRNLLGTTGALDGGASVAANESGEVFIVWHGKRQGDGGDEKARVVFVLKSADNGATFSSPAVANADFAGVCACCSLKALATPGGGLVTLYRAARTSSQRDMTLLTSADHGATFAHDTLHPWSVAMCPMSSAALLQTAKGIRAAWETDGKIFSTVLSTQTLAPAEISTGKAKHPALAVNARGETLVAWDIGTGWNRGGELAWIILDAAGLPTAQRGKSGGVPTWSHVAAYDEPGGDFVILR